jgi:hypothetical protein
MLTMKQAARDIAFCLSFAWTMFLLPATIACCTISCSATITEMIEHDLAASFAYRLSHVVRLASKREMSNDPSHFAAPVPGANSESS